MALTETKEISLSACNHMLPYSNNRIAAVLILLFFIAVAAYAYFEAQGILYGPEIQIATPENAPITVDTELVHVRGAAKNITELLLNGNPVYVTESGVFDEALLLSEGYNREVLEARDRFGRTTKKVLEIVYTPTTDTSPSVESLINTTSQ